MSIIDRTILTKGTLKSAAGEIANNAKYSALQDISDIAFGVTRKPTKTTGEAGAFSVDAFRASFADGIGSPAYFQFKLKALPPFMQGKVNDDVLRKLPMRMRRSAIPDMALQTHPITYNGVPSKVAYENSTGDLNIEVVSSGNLWEREFFTAWQNYIVDYSTPDKNPTFDVAYYNDYVTEAELDIYNDEGEKVTTILFNGVYPLSMTMVDMDWTSKDQLLVFSLVLTYAYWSIDYSKSEISKTVYEKTSVLGSLVDTLKTVGIDKVRKTLDKII